MRPLRLAVTALVATITLASPARAEEEFHVEIAVGLLAVHAHEGWHISKDFPWKLVVGDTKLDKTKFVLEEKTAKVLGAPQGVGKLKGAVCSKDMCRTFEKEVTVQ